MPENKGPKAKKKIVKPDKKVPKIRIVSLDKNSLVEDSGGCKCETDSCNCEGHNPCKCVGEDCNCDGYKPCSACLLMPQKSDGDSRTFFKIVGSE